jgi:hypothetical protein
MPLSRSHVPEEQQATTGGKMLLELLSVLTRNSERFALPGVRSFIAIERFAVVPVRNFDGIDKGGNPSVLFLFLALLKPRLEFLLATRAMAPEIQVKSIAPAEMGLVFPVFLAALASRCYVMRDCHIWNVPSAFSSSPAL